MLNQREINSTLIPVSVGVSGAFNYLGYAFNGALWSLVDIQKDRRNLDG
jgi:hypothetical protein